MSKLIRNLAILVFSVLLIAQFQNCGQAFEPGSDSGGSIAQSEQGVVETPESMTPVYLASRLQWNFPIDDIGFATVTRNLGSRCPRRIEDFLRDKEVTAVIFDEGLLPGDPRIEEMRLVKRSLATVLDIAFCAYFATDETVKEQALAEVKNYIYEWEAAYVGDGNPINDRFFTNLFLAVDLVSPKLSREDHEAIRNLASIIETKEVEFMEAFDTNDNRLRNNWFTRHLVIRYFANITLRDDAVLNLLKAEFERTIGAQYNEPADYNPSSCSNLMSVGAYGSFDLQQRDSFLYHSSGIKDILPLLLLEEGFVSEASKQALLEAVNILRPYVLNQRSHPEFQCTVVAYDIERLQLNPALGNNWDPDSEAQMFRYARLVWPETKEWTTRFETNDHPLWFRILFNAYGDGSN